MYKKHIVTRIGLSILILLVGGAGIFFLAWSGNRVRTTNDLQSFGAILMYAGIYMALWYVVFWHMLKFKMSSEVKSHAITTGDLTTKIKSYFNEAKSQEDVLFLIKDIPKGIEISWNKNITYNQLVTFGDSQINYQVTSRFNEHTHTCDIHSKIVEQDRSVGIFGALFSRQSTSGIVYESTSTYTPSFSISDGTVRVDVKKLQFNNATIIDPIVEICKQNGWNIRFQMFKHAWAQTV